jgi:formylglycine-generating enzyme required for sulfatase activity
MFTYENHKWENRKGRSFRNPGFAQTPRHPVVGASWHDAAAYCEWLSKTTSKAYRLPSEAEWEYACRAGTTAKYHWGEELTAEQVNCKTGDLSAALLGETKGDEQAVRTNVQGRYPANAWGLYDMHGNVQEWCEDEWHDRYDGAPPDGSAWLTPGDEDPFRALRGGSCWHYTAACSSASRQSIRADVHDKPDELLDDDLLGALFRDRPPISFRIVVEVS